MSDSHNPTILLIGCGYTLTRLLKKLPVASVLYTTRSITSLEEAPKLIGSKYHGEVLDLTRADSIKKIFDKYPSIHTILDSSPPVGGENPTQGVRNLCEVLTGIKVHRLFYLSTTGVYGVHDGSEVSEDTPCTPTSPRAKARLESEDLYKTVSPNTTIFRISAIYGPGRGLGISLKQGTYVGIEGKKRWSNRIHVDDLANILHCGLKFKGILPNCFNVSDDCPALIDEVVAYYCKKFDLSKPKMMTEEEAIAMDSHAVSSNQRILNERVKQELELVLKYPSYKEGAGTEY